jgi:putative DNA-invertase from lambdoid prophage Rac
MMKKCLIYARCSTLDQATENQIVQLKRYAEAQEWEVSDAITDLMSGSKGINERKGLEKVFEMAHRRQFDVLLFWSLDRLSREGSRKTIEYLSRLENLGVDWHSFTEPYLSSMGVFSDAIISLLASLAKQERIRIGERTRAGMERVRRLGLKKIGRPRTTDTRIGEVMELRKQGLTLSAIGDKLNITAARVCQIIKMKGINEGAESQGCEV